MQPATISASPRAEPQPVRYLPATVTPPEKFNRKLRKVDCYMRVMNWTEVEKAAFLLCILDQYIFDTWYSKIDNVDAFS